jgi:hypothetical protein
VVEWDVRVDIAVGGQDVGAEDPALEGAPYLVDEGVKVTGWSERRDADDVHVGRVVRGDVPAHSAA